jgi:ATP-binding cassette subfamily F protein 3
VLLLDEPTNHLDIESLEWLEAYLKSYAGAILLVSHDRRFLDNLVRRTVEITQGRGTEYAGNYSDYLREKENRRGLLEAAFENQQKMIRETERFIERFRAKSTKAKQVQSRMKRIEKVELIELETDEEEIAFRFPTPPRSGRVVLHLEGVDKRYGDTRVLDGVSLIIERGDRVAVLGVNGAGKSTLARVLAGTEPIQGGRRTEGHQVIASYYAQNQADALNPAKTVLESVEEVAAFGTGGNLRTLLGHFLFSEDDVFKRVSVLSGGEKSRLALARMLLVPANFLILDEPTNHLDLRSKEVLKEALRNFNGTFAIVSHDRDFLAGLITKVIVAKDRGLVVYPGSVDDYLRIWHEKETGEQLGKTGADPDAGSRSGNQGERERKRREAERRQERYRRLRPLKDDVENLLSRIGQMEKRKEELESMLADPRTYGDANQARSAGSEYREIAPVLDALYQQWSVVQEKIDAIEQEMTEAGEL